MYTFRRGEVTLYAKWVDALEVTIDSNGGTPEIPITLNVGKGAIISFPEGIKYPGKDNKFNGYRLEDINVTRFDETNQRYYEFTGWNLVKDGTKNDHEDTHVEPGARGVRVNSSVTVYAEWRKPVTIHYEPNGGSGYMEDETAYFAGDVVVLDENNYNRDGEMLAFLGWNTARDGSGIYYDDGDMFIIEDDLTLYAQWSDAVVVRFNGNGATEGYMENQIVPTNVLTTLNKNAFRRDSYSFTGWNTDPNGLGTSYDDGDLVLLGSNVTLYAQWEQSLFNVSFYDGDAFIKNVQVSKGNVIELIDYDMTSAGKVLIGWSLVKGRDVAAYTVGQGYTPTEDTTFYAVSGEAVRITFVINGDSSNTQILARSTLTELRAFESMEIDPPDMTKYFDCWRDTKYNTYKDRQTVSLTSDVVLTAQWREAEELAPAAPSQVKVSKHLVNYRNDLLNGHAGELSGLANNMEYYADNGNWQTFPRTPIQSGIAKPYNFEIRYAENTYTRTPPSKSVIRPIYSFVSEASDPVDNSTLREEIYSYDVNIYSVRASGEKQPVMYSTDEWTALEDVLSIEDIYFLLDYPNGITKNSNMLTLEHDGRQVEIHQLSKGILGKANSFTNPEFVLHVRDKLVRFVFEPNGGGGAAMESIGEAIGSRIILPSCTYTRRGYNFTGWNTMPDGSGNAYSDCAQITVREDMTLYAQWEKAKTITIDETNFPDNIFRNYVVTNFDKDGNNILNEAEMAAVTRIDVSGPWNNPSNITSVIGIDFFPNLSYLNCESNQIFSLDVSQNTALENLSCGQNQISGLDVSQNKALKKLYCTHNQISSLDVSQNTALQYLHCGHNQISSLDVSRNTALKELETEHNPLYSIDVNKNTLLTRLDVLGTQLTELDVSHNTKLQRLTCHGNYLTSLDVSHNPQLTYLCCWGNELTELDISQNTNLTSLLCNNNQLTSLDVSCQPALTHLDCGNNKLKRLDIRGNTELRDLDCRYNMLPSLDVSQNTKLTILCCGNNQLNYLDVSNNSKLIRLQCHNNNITDLDISCCPDLVHLICSENKFSSLDISNSPSLTRLMENTQPISEYGHVIYGGEHRSLGEDMLQFDQGITLFPNLNAILVLPSGTKQIEEEAFAGGGFSYVRIQNNAITIGSRAFADCPNLAVVEIPASVRFIADDAFENDGDLIIGGIRGSAAESYANRKGYSFVVIATAP